MLLQILVYHFKSKMVSAKASPTHSGRVAGVDFNATIEKRPSGDDRFSMVGSERHSTNLFTRQSLCDFAKPSTI